MTNFALKFCLCLRTYSISERLVMTDTPTVLDTINAKWYNTLAKELGLAESEFQLCQGETILPQNTDQLWDMMNQLPSDSVIQYYTADPLVSFSSQYLSLLSFVQTPGNENFETAMGSVNLTAWKAALKTFLQNNPSAFGQPPAVLQATLQNLFQNWSMVEFDPGSNPDAGSAAQCFTLYCAMTENPIYVAQALKSHLPLGGPAAFNQTYGQVLNDILAAPSESFSMDSTQASSDISQSWANSSSSTGGSYFYSKSSSSASSDFTQTFSSAAFSVAVAYDHFVTVPVLALQGESVTDGGTTYLPWYYGAALAYAYNNNTAPVWTDPTQWTKLFGPEGSMQYVITALLVADGVSTTTTSTQAFSAAEQTFAEQQSNEGYGCWPYYVSNSSDKKTQTSTAFDSGSHLVVSTTSKTGNPLVVGVLVSSVKALVQKA